MEIKKSQRLSQFLGVISGMVQYTDIGTDMVENGILSLPENKRLLKKLEREGNVNVMNELLTIVNLRQGGFDGFLESLRRNDYEWIAEQLDPGKMFTDATMESANNKGFLSGFRTAKHRRSEPSVEHRRMSEEHGFSFLTYRDSCPVDITFLGTNTQSAELPRSFCPLFEPPTSVGDQTDASLSLDNLQVKDTEVARDTDSVALVENVPKSIIPSKSEYFANLAKKLHVPAPAALKVITSRKISKTAHQSAKFKNIKLRFSSEEERNTFINSITQFISNLKPNDELYDTAHQFHVSVPAHKNASSQKPNFFKMKTLSKVPILKKKHSIPEGPDSVNTQRKHWYQHRFNLKSWSK